MTALVALDLYSLNELVLVPEICANLDTTKAGLVPGRLYFVNDLINSLLISSAGDAACTLSMGKVTYNEFISLMNDKAGELELSSTHFTNPIGLDAENNSHISSAYDLYLLTKGAVSKDIIKKAVQTSEYSFKEYESVFSNQSNFVSKNPEIRIQNTNKLLGEIEGTVGVKTGTTAEAGEVLIYQYKKDGVDLIIVVMGSSDRFSDTKTLLNWALSKYSWN
jgi:D-alanyl-D-alanine carboxypeptidase (penicillin-binding protein 5/6)